MAAGSAAHRAAPAARWTAFHQVLTAKDGHWQGHRPWSRRKGSRLQVQLGSRRRAQSVRRPYFRVGAATGESGTSTAVAMVAEAFLCAASKPAHTAASAAPSGPQGAVIDRCQVRTYHRQPFADGPSACVSFGEFIARPPEEHLGMQCCCSTPRQTKFCARHCMLAACGLQSAVCRMPHWALLQSGDSREQGIPLANRAEGFCRPEWGLPNMLPKGQAGE